MFASVAIPSPRLHEVNLKHFQKTSKSCQVDWSRHRLTLSAVDVNFTGTMLFNMMALRHFIKQNEAGVTAPKGGYTSKFIVWPTCAYTRVLMLTLALFRQLCECCTANTPTCIQV